MQCSDEVTKKRGLTGAAPTETTVAEKTPAPRPAAETSAAKAPGEKPAADKR